MKIYKAKHEGMLILGELKIPCAVLENGVRVINSKSFQTELGLANPAGMTHSQQNGAEAALPGFLRSKALKPYISATLRAMTVPLEYTPFGGGRAKGLRCEILPEVGKTWIQAGLSGALTGSKQLLALRGFVELQTGLATAGIAALVDEATGYQQTRAQDALSEIVNRYLGNRVLPYTKRFPDEFFNLMKRLKGWQGMPLAMGHVVNNVVYSRLAPGVLEELKMRNPKDEISKKRRVAHHQWLSQSTGIAALDSHIRVVMGFARASANWDQFMHLLSLSCPIVSSGAFENEQEELPFEVKSLPVEQIKEPIRIPEGFKIIPAIG